MKTATRNIRSVVAKANANKQPATGAMARSGRGAKWSAMALGAAALAASLAPMGAQAFYDKNDRSEAYFILPNESAFFIPDVGSSKEGQAQFDSEAFLASKKIAAKRFEIPHAKFSGSGGVNSIFSDYYVPTGRVIIVDRSPYNREWTKDHARGTASKNESFPCQSSEGLNVTVEVTLGASVMPENAAKFLYYFGIEQPKGDRGDPNVIFQSVYHGRSLGAVMDTNGRGYIQRAVCKEIMSRTLTQANQEAGKIQDIVENKSREFLATRGITLDYLGWAGTFEFDHDVQKAIDDSYVARTTEPVVGTLQKLADIKVKEGLAEGLKKGINFLPQGISDWFTGMIRSDSGAAAKK